MVSRMPKVVVLVTVLFCIGRVSGGLFAEDQLMDQPTELFDVVRDVFAPFVSRLRVAVRDPQIRLTWRDAEDLDGGSYRVYRHTAEITRDTFAAAKLVAEVPPGTETWLDTPEEGGNYFYAVIAVDKTDTVFPIFVPFRNKTIRSVTIAQVKTEEDLAAKVSDIAAMVQDHAVVVRFETSRGGRDLVVYRTTTPFRTVDDIQAATLLDEFESTTRRFVDYPVPGVDYYYGVFDKSLIERGSVSITPGENTLTTAVRIGLDAAPDITLQFPRSPKRRAPLPMLHLVRDIRTGERLARNPTPERSEVRMSQSAESAVAYFLARAPEPVPFRPEPVVLPEERSGDGEGVARTLSEVVRTDFAQERYAVATDHLRRILTLPLSDTLERRTRFYLGQALYFDGRHEPAFMEFLLASEGELYSQTKPWLNGILLPWG